MSCSDSCLHIHEGAVVALDKVVVPLRRTIVEAVLERIEKVGVAALAGVLADIDLFGDLLVRFYAPTPDYAYARLRG